MKQSANRARLAVAQDHGKAEWDTLQPAYCQHEPSNTCRTQHLFSAWNTESNCQNIAGATDLKKPVVAFESTKTPKKHTDL